MVEHNHPQSERSKTPKPEPKLKALPSAEKCHNKPHAYLSLLYFGVSRSWNPIINQCTQMRRNNSGVLCFWSIGERQIVSYVSCFIPKSEEICSDTTPLRSTTPIKIMKFHSDFIFKN